ncbi:hypothetical protein BJX96DRAFT_11903 [Aspergillus floccosus]
MLLSLKSTTNDRWLGPPSGKGSISPCSVGWDIEKQKLHHRIVIGRETTSTTADNGMRILVLHRPRRLQSSPQSTPFLPGRFASRRCEPSLGCISFSRSPGSATSESRSSTCISPRKTSTARSSLPEDQDAALEANSPDRPHWKTSRPKRNRRHIIPFFLAITVSS